LPTIAKETERRMSEPKPTGSGWFSLVAGVIFLVVLLASAFTNLREVCPYTLFQAWLLFSALTLIAWGVNRVRTGRPEATIGQNTINFVVGLIAATIALFTLVATAPACR
jgi:hypothetical protein